MAWTKLYFAIGVAAAAAIALQWGKIETQKTELSALQSQLQLASQTNQQQLAAIKELETRDETMARSLRNIVAETTQSSARKAPAAAPPVAAPASGAALEKKGFGSMMENMMKDPEMMKMIQEQQAQVLKTQYAPLVKQLNLTPDQRDAFYKVLSDNTTNAMAQGLALLSGTNNPDAASAAAGSLKTMQDQMKPLLGDTGYAQFQDFQTSLPDRMMFEQIKTSFADDPLTDDQQQSLLQIMINERKNAASAVDPNTAKPAVAPAGFAGATEQAVQTQEQINQRVYQQAAGFLSPNQLQSLGNSQSNFLNLTKMSMTMAQRFMGTNFDGDSDDVMIIDNP
jgi:hypothetical protein